MQHEKRATREKCDTELASQKKSATRRKHNTERMQHGESATRKECNTKKLQHEKSATSWKEWKRQKFNMEIAKHEKSVTRKKVQHESSATWWTSYSDRVKFRKKCTRRVHNSTPTDNEPFVNGPYTMVLWFWLAIAFHLLVIDSNANVLSRCLV